VTVLLQDAEVRAAVDLAGLVDAVESLYKDGLSRDAVLPARLNLNHSGAFLRVMPAMLPGQGLMGMKIFHRGHHSGVSYLVALYDMDSGEALALVDAAYLTAARTGATSAVAARHLAPAATTAAVLGSGLEAETNLLAIASRVSLEHVRVYSPRPERRAQFAGRMAAILGIPVVACDDAPSAVRRADLVIVATNTGPSRRVAFQSEWIEDGQCIVSIGSTNPGLREVDEATFRRAAAVVVDASAEQIAEESGDVIALCAQPDGASEFYRRAVPLASVVTNGHSAVSGAEVLLFKSVGTAAQDLVAARMAYEAATASGAGRRIDDLISPKFFL
jgi:alanine dehydrogenase